MVASRHDSAVRQEGTFPVIEPQKDNATAEGSRPGRPSLWDHLLPVLPFIIAISYMAVFSTIDGYPYSISSLYDQGLFQRIALNLLRKGQFSGSLGGHAVFCPTRPPLYPLVLALTWKITESTSLLPIRLIQGICYLFTIYFISRIATMVAGGNRKYGMLSALFASVIPFAAAATHLILTESLALFFLAMAVFFAVRFRTGAGRSSLVVLGASLGLLILQRPTFMLIPALLLGYVLLAPKIKKKDFIPVVLLVMLPLTAVIAPWTMYARSETGSWSPVRAGLGYNLMSGILENNPPLRETLARYWKDAQNYTLDKQAVKKKLDMLSNAENEPTSWDDSSHPDTCRLIDLTGAIYLQEWYTEPPSARAVIQSDNFLKRMALLWIKDNPLHFLAIIVSNVRTLLFGDYQPLAYHAIGGNSYLYIVVLKWGLYLSFLMGTILLILQRRFHIVFFPLAISFYIIIVHSLMHTEPRYFMYAYTFMAITVPVLLSGQSPREKSGPDGRGHHE